MNTTLPCENCGTATEYSLEGSTACWRCPNCGWSVVTTSIPEIELDETKYSVFVTASDYKNKEQVKAVSEVSGKNFLEARKAMQEERVLILQEEAVTVAKARDLLQKSGVGFEIEPKFPF